MLKHRIVFSGVWIAFTIALFIFPGFEARGFVKGMMLGYWPLPIFERIYKNICQQELIVFFTMVMFSGFTVGLLAWLVDAAQMTNKIWILLVISMIVGAAYFAAHGLSYEDWQNTPAVTQAMESPEVNYQPNRWDFNKAIIIPRTLVGGLWGLYGVTGICALIAVVIMLRSKPKANHAGA